MVTKAQRNCSHSARVPRPSITRAIAETLMAKRDWSPIRVNQVRLTPWAYIRKSSEAALRVNEMDDDARAKRDTKRMSPQVLVNQRPTWIDICDCEGVRS